MVQKINFEREFRKFTKILHFKVNSTSLRDCSHDKAIQLLRQTPPKVRLLVYRDPSFQAAVLNPLEMYNIFDVELLKKPGRGLGLSIVGRKTQPGVFVSEVVSGGVAESDGRLMSGDQILAVNGKDLTNAKQDEAATILKTVQGKVALKIGRLKVNSQAISPATPIQPTQILTPTPSPRSPNAPTDVGVISAAPPSTPPAAPLMTAVAPASPPAPPAPTVDHLPVVDQRKLSLSPIPEKSTPGSSPSPHPPAESPNKELSSSDDQQLHPDEPEIPLLDLHEENCDSLLIELMKNPDRQLGMGVGMRPRGVLVTSVQAGSVAGERLQVGDRIMAVNGKPVANQQEAVAAVKISGQRLVLQIARPKSESTTTLNGSR